MKEKIEVGNIITRDGRCLEVIDFDEAELVADYEISEHFVDIKKIGITAEKLNRDFISRIEHNKLLEEQSNRHTNERIEILDGIENHIEKDYIPCSKIEDFKNKFITKTYFTKMSDEKFFEILDAINKIKN